MDEARRPLRITLHPSRTLALALVTVYTGAALCLLSLDLGSGIATLTLALLTLSGYCDIRSHLGRHPRRAREIVLHRDDDWRVVDAFGGVSQGRPFDAVMIHSLAVCFSIRSAGGKRVPVLVLKDMCSAEAFRRLRVWLNTNRGRRSQPGLERHAGWPISGSDGSRS